MAGRVPSRVVAAAAIAAMGAVTAIALPMFTCTDPYEFEEFPGPGGGPTCAFTDMGYRPTSWLPTKITVAVAGLIIALAILLWPRWPLVSTGIVIALAAIAAPWFIEDGYQQTMQNGRPVCCGREISREWLRTGIVVVGSLAGTVLAVIGFVRARRRDMQAPAVES